MLSAVITALLLCVMLMIIGSLIFSALRGRKRQMLAQATQEPTQPLDSRVTVVLQLQDGMLVGVEKPAPKSVLIMPSSWYSRHRKILSVGLLLMLLLALFVQNGLADGALQDLSKGIGISFLSYSQPIDIQTVAHSAPSTASMRLVRVDSAARNQY